MQVILHTNALELNAANTPAHAGYSKERMKWRKSLSEMMNAKPDLTFEVDTTHLFKNNFNVINPLSDICIQIPSYMVEKVIDDERIGKSKCTWCGKVVTTGEACGDHDPNYLEVML